MSNETMERADGATHLKIVAMSLAASIVVLAVCISARTLPADDSTQRVVSHGPVIKATKQIVTTTNDMTVIR